MTLKRLVFGILIFISWKDYVSDSAFNFATDFKNVCPYIKTCSLNQTLYPANSKVSSGCSACSCEPLCRIKRDCCPDYEDLDGIDHVSDDKIDMQCLPLENMLSNSSYADRALALSKHYLTIHSCPKGQSSNSHADGCHSEFSSKVVDYIPVVDWRTSLIYKNYHCAYCHNITDPIAWNIDTTCLELYLVDTVPETVEALRNLMNDCDIRLKAPLGTHSELQLCRTDSYQNIIASCNQTGHWNYYDAYVFEKCNSEVYISLFYDSSPLAEGNPESLIYKNPFCFLCNSNESMSNNLQCKQAEKVGSLSDIKHVEQPVSFKTMLDVNNLVYSEIFHSENLRLAVPDLDGIMPDGLQHCGHGQFFDLYTRKCRELRCPINEYAVNGICIPKSSVPFHLSVAGYLQVHLLEPSSIHMANFSVDNDIVQSLNKTLINEVFARCDVQNITCTSSSESQHITDIFVAIVVSTNGDCLVQEVLKLFKLFDKDTGNHFKVKMDDYSYEIKMIYSRFPTDVSIGLVRGSYAKSIHLNRFFYCPRVVLGIREYNDSVSTGALIHLGDSVYGLDSTLKSGSIEVCLDDYERKRFLNDPRTTDSGISIMSITSAACSILSMICIIVILVTFTIFKELRFMPGKLFLVLCTNLLIAQGFYEFGIGVGGSGYLCVFLGITIHYSWLAAFFAMNSCIGLMFKNFHRPLKTSSRSSVLTQKDANTEVLKFAIYIYSCPVIFVLTNIIASLIMTGNQSVGYGGKYCYINSAMMRALLFALPLAVIILVNFILFGVILYDIMKVASRNLKTESHKNRRKAVIFLKFSTITGIYWIFGYLYEVTKLEFVGYIFILLNAGQGAFLMVSFLFNRRVMMLYQGLFCDFTRRKDSRSHCDIVVLTSSPA